MRILSELTKDASISVPQLSKKLNINASVLYSRIKRLAKRTLIQKFTIIVNERMLGVNIKATVGINRDPKLKEPIHSELLNIPEVRSLSEVIGKVEGIQNTETFVEMQRSEKDPVYTVHSSLTR